MELWQEQMEIKMLREGVPDVEMEGLEPKDETDKDEGDVEDVELGWQSSMWGLVHSTRWGVHGPAELVREYNMGIMGLD